MYIFLGNRTQVQPPSVWIIDLQTDEVVKRFEISETVAGGPPRPNGLISITVDVEDSECQNAFAYIPDMFGSRLYIYE